MSFPSPFSLFLFFFFLFFLSGLASHWLWVESRDGLIAGNPGSFSSPPTRLDGKNKFMFALRQRPFT
jgi:hypothetical protein